jgi:hypothetical protein
MIDCTRILFILPRVLLVGYACGYMDTPIDTVRRAS